MTSRRRRTLRIGRPIAALLLVGGVFGLTLLAQVRLPFGLAATALAAAAGIAWLAVGVREADAPPDDRPEPRAGARSDVAWLTWSLSSRRRGLEGQSLERVRAMVRQRFVRRGLDPDDPDVRAALETSLGPASWAFLHDPHPGPVTLAAVEHCLDVLDEQDARERGRARR